MTKYCLKMQRRDEPNTISVIGSSIDQPLFVLEKLAKDMATFEVEYWVDVWSDD
jgi:hypothetical protein